MGSLIQEVLEDALVKREDLLEEVSRKGANVSVLLPQINALNALLGEEAVSDDPLFDKWERELAEGRDPDLDEVL